MQTQIRCGQIINAHGTDKHVSFSRLNRIWCYKRGCFLIRVDHQIGGGIGGVGRVGLGGVVGVFSRSRGGG